MAVRSPPAAEEYAAAFADYVAEIAEEEDVLAVLAGQLDDVLARLGSAPDSRGEYRYAPGKWSLKNVVGRLSDTERMFTCRALWIARRHLTPEACRRRGTAGLEARYLR